MTDTTRPHLPRVGQARPERSPGKLASCPPALG